MIYQYWMDRRRAGKFPIRLYCETRRAGEVFPLHWHNAVELIWVVEGQIEVQREDGMQRVEAGQLCCIHSRHSHLINIPCENSRYYCFIIPPVLIPEEELFNAPLPQITTDQRCLALCRELVETELARPEYFIQLALSLLAQLYIRLVWLRGTQLPARENTRHSIVQETVKYVEAHYAEPLSVEQIAAAVGLSRHHLCHVFKSTTGSTLAHYWQTVRCHVARDLLHNGATAAQAADACGFTSYAHFSNVYYRIFGVRPAADKQTNQAGWR